MITPVIKDEIILFIITKKRTRFLITYPMVSNLDISEDELWMIIEQLTKKGLIKSNELGYVECTADLYDFFNHGGFTAQEELLRANIEKLNLELLNLSKDLEPSMLERINTISSIANNITMALGLFSNNS